LCALFIVIGVVLCAFILIPLFTMFFALILMLVPPNRLYLLLSTIADVVAFVLSGFLMGLLIAYFSKNREMSATSLGALIVIISVCTIPTFSMPNIQATV